jgi:hypothetical protein
VLGCGDIDWPAAPPECAPVIWPAMPPPYGAGREDMLPGVPGAGWGAVECHPPAPGPPKAEPGAVEVDPGAGAEWAPGIAAALPEVFPVGCAPNAPGGGAEPGPGLVVCHPPPALPAAGLPAVG